MPGLQSRRWCYTLNNYTDEDVHRLEQLFEGDGVSYHVFGRETGDSGTPHLQGYIELARKKTIGGVKAILGSNSAHLEISRGTSEQAALYCKKDGAYHEYGRPMEAGRRTDLENIKQAIDAGATMGDVAGINFGLYCQYRRSFEHYAAMVIRPRDFRTQCVWIYGTPGRGKSRYCNGQAGLGERPVYWLSDLSGTWFDGYHGEPHIIIDDFDGSMRYSTLLRLLDRYPLRVPVKGGFTEFRARVCFISSNKPPSEFYPKEDHRALRRRIDELYCVDDRDWKNCPRYPREEEAEDLRYLMSGPVHGQLHLPESQDLLRVELSQL